MLTLLSKILSRRGVLEKDEEVRKSFDQQKVVDKAMETAMDIVATPPRSIGVTVAGIELLSQCFGGDEAGNALPTIRPMIATRDEVDWAPLTSGLRRLLASNSNIPLSARETLVAALRRASLQSSTSAEKLFPVLPTAVRAQVLGAPWPEDISLPPMVSIMYLARDLLASSRQCAEQLVELNLAESLLRYLHTLKPGHRNRLLLSL